ncbi:ATP-binding protein, partial [Novosphingobium huizhouense]
DQRAAIHDSALVLARATSYRGIGTFEFLVDLDAPDRFVFIEANPRLQVEHTVTEEVTGLDLVAMQFALAQGATLDGLGLYRAEPVGVAIQLRL